MKKIMQHRMTRASGRGFTLIELMIATTLGILISLGLTMLFQATAKTNRVQDAMAQLQESGRYAISRINNDLRMASFQSLNVSGFVSATPSATATPNGVNNPTLSIRSHVAAINLPDFGTLSAPVGWKNPNTSPADWPAGQAWPLSQRYFIQGYECSSVSPCSPTLPTGANALPAAGLAAGNRIQSADVLTVRYLNSLGWSLSKNEISFSCGSGANPPLSSISIAPTTNFKSGDLALLVSISSAELFQVNVSGSVLTPTAVLNPVLRCPVDPNSPFSGSDVTLYDFSQDFHTITYYLKLDADPNDSTRLIPALVRRDSTIDNQGAASNDQELVQGIEQMDFLFGAQTSTIDTSSTPPIINANLAYLTAEKVEAQSSPTTCPPMASSQIVDSLPAYSVEPGCLWRSLNSIEVHLLVDSVNNLYDLTAADMAYQYTYGYGGTDAKQTPASPPSANTALTSGLKAGKMLRREFVSLVSVRNFNP